MVEPMPTPPDFEGVELKKDRPLLLIVICIAIAIFLVIVGIFWYRRTRVDLAVNVPVPTDNFPSSDVRPPALEPAPVIPTPLVTTTSPLPVPTSTAPTPSPIPTPTSTGGTTPTPNPTSTPTPAPAPVVTVTRLANEEATSIVPNTGWTTLFTMQVGGNQPTYALTYVLFRVSLGNTAPADVFNALSHDSLFALEQSTNGGQTWQEINRSAVTTAAGGKIGIRFEFTNGLQLPTNAKFRLRGWRIPCELEGNTVDVTILDDRGGQGFRFASYATAEYQESRHPITISTCASARTKPVDPAAWLRFEETSGTIMDQANNGNHASVITSGVQYAQPGKKTKALHFGPTNDYIQIPVGSGPRAVSAISDPASVEFMMKMEKDNAWQGLIGEGDGTTQYDYLLAIAPNNRLAFYTEVGQAWYVSSKVVQKNVWYHVGFTVGSCYTEQDGRRVGCLLNLYVDGQPQTVELYAGAHNGPAVLPRDVALGFSGNRAVTIGGWPGPAGQPHLYPFQGLIDEVAIYDRVVSREEMVDRYKGNL